MDTLTKANLVKFLDFSIEKGLIKAATGNARKAATTQILEAFGPDDDLSEVDVPSEVLKYNNRHPGKLSPDSLTTYQGRVVAALQEFSKYLENPRTYKGVIGRSTAKPVAKNSLTAGAAETPTATDEEVDEQPVPRLISRAAPPTSAVTDTSLMLPFPLRPAFLAQLIIPRDLSQDEANRLCAFIQALAIAPPAVPT